MNVFQQKSLNFNTKKTASRKEEITRLYSDSLRDFQSNISKFKIIDKKLWRMFFSGKL